MSIELGESYERKFNMKWVMKRIVIFLKISINSVVFQTLFITYIDIIQILKL